MHAQPSTSPAFKRNLLGDLDKVPRPPVRRTAVELLADWLEAYGAHKPVAPLPDVVFRSYLKAGNGSGRRAPVFAGLVAPSRAEGGEVV